MANLFWRGSTGVSASDWNTASNWYVVVDTGGTGGVPFETKLTVSTRSPVGQDSVYVWDSLPFAVVGASGITTGALPNSPILANCLSGGMTLSGSTYWWLAAGTSSGVTGTNPLEYLNVVVGNPMCTGASYGKFVFNSEKMPLFFKQAAVQLLHAPSRSDMNPGNTGATASNSWRMCFNGVINSGYTLAENNVIIPDVDFAETNSTAVNTWGQNRIDLEFGGKIGRLEVEPWNKVVPAEGMTTILPQGIFFGSVAADPFTTVESVIIRGQPQYVNLPIGTTCNSLLIEPLNFVSGITTDIYVQCTIGATTNAYSSASGNNYSYLFKGIRFQKSLPISVTASNYNIFIGTPSVLSANPASLYYNLWENNISNVLGGAANIVARGPVFINDVLLEDSVLKISPNARSTDSFIIKQAEVRGNSVIDLRKTISIIPGVSASIPMVLGAAALAAGHTGAKGLLYSSALATFINHPDSTVSF